MLCNPTRAEIAPNGEAAAPARPVFGQISLPSRTATPVAVEPLAEDHPRWTPAATSMSPISPFEVVFHNSPTDSPSAGPPPPVPPHWHLTAGRLSRSWQSCPSAGKPALRNPEHSTTEVPIPRSKSWQRVAAICANVGAAVLLTLLIVWLKVGENFSFAWQPGNSVQFFRLHVLLGTLPVFFLTLGVVAWRHLPVIMSSGAVKLVHSLCNVGAMICTILCQYVTFDVNSSRPPLVTFHSWLAVLGIFFFAIQTTGGGIVYLVPWFPRRLQRRIQPAHASLGLLTYVVIVCVALTGLAEFLTDRLGQQTLLGSGVEAGPQATAATPWLATSTQLCNATAAAVVLCLVLVYVTLYPRGAGLLATKALSKQSTQQELNKADQA